MAQRIVAIFFPGLLTDWMVRRQPALKDEPFVLAQHEKNRRVVKAVNQVAQSKGIYTGMVVADCKAILPELQVFDYDPTQPEKLLNALAEWCIRFTPYAAVSLPDTLLLDVNGCAHLWGGERSYLNHIEIKITGLSYTICTAMADTIGAAWALSHFGISGTILKPGAEAAGLQDLPIDALRVEQTMVAEFKKLGFKTIGSILKLPRTALRRRFSRILLTRLSQALGGQMEILTPVTPIPPYQEHLPSVEPIKTAIGIEMALKDVLKTLCERLAKENKGLRKAEFRCHRIDGNIQKIDIGTSRPSRSPEHLFKLFQNRIAQIEPDLGIEVFTIDALVVEELLGTQDALWNVSGANEVAIAELLDRIAGKTGPDSIHRYLPSEHYWPERSIKKATALSEQPTSTWRTDLPRPSTLLEKPEQIKVIVRMPDYPPHVFFYKGQRHEVMKADGPERIEQEWWIQDGEYRDYYCIENDKGARYWIFRSGDYRNKDVRWFLHGFFA